MQCHLLSEAAKWEISVGAEQQGSLGCTGEQSVFFSLSWMVSHGATAGPESPGCHPHSKGGTANPSSSLCSGSGLTVRCSSSSSSQRWHRKLAGCSPLSSADKLEHRVEEKESNGAAGEAGDTCMLLHWGQALTVLSTFRCVGGKI